MKKTEHKISRETILKKLQKEITDGVPIVFSGIGTGIVGRIVESAGADMAVVYSSGYFRMNGHSSILGNLPVGDANQIVYDLGKDFILPIVHDIPVVAGVFGVDPTRDMDRFLELLAEIGFSGVTNYPTVGKFSGKFRQEIEGVGLGYQREAEVMKLAHEKGFITIGYVYKEEEARIMVRAGVDFLAAHAGLTSGGDIGASCAFSLDETIRNTQKILSAGLEENPKVIPLCHGGSIETPEDFDRVFRETCAVGFIGASSIERIPVEKAIAQTIQKFKSIRR